MAEKGKSLKLQKWTKKDVALVITAYVINAILFTLLFVGMCFLNAAAENKSVNDMFSDGAAVVDFAIIISLILAITAVYFMFEETYLFSQQGSYSNASLCARCA